MTTGTQTGKTIDLETLALIAAAVAMEVEGPHRILSAEPVRILDTPAFMINPWSMEGRFQIFRTRQVR